MDSAEAGEGTSAAEMAVRSNEARLLQVFSNCPVGLAIHRLSDRTFLDVNAAFTALLGWTRDEVLGRTTTELGMVDEAAAGRLRSELQGNGTLRDAEAVLRSRAGDVRHVILGTELVELNGEPHSITTFVDVTGRKRAEDKRDEAWQLAQATIDALSAHVCVLDETGTILASNEAWRRFAASNPSVRRASEGDNYLQVCDGATQPEAAESAAFAAGIRSVISGQAGGFAMEYGCHPPSEQRWFLGRVTRFGGGGPVRVVVTQEDITERKLAADAQRASEQRYRTLFDYAPDGILIADRDSYYLDANTSICRMLGYSRDELIRLHASNIVEPQEVQHIESALRAITETAGYQREWQFRRKDGSTFPAEVIATEMPDGNLLAMIRDVTGRKQAESALRDERDNAQRYLDTAEVMLLALDAAGRITRVNRMACSLLEWTERELLGRDWIATCLPVRTRQAVAEKFDKLLHGDLSVVENAILTRSGEERLIEWRNTVLRDDDGRVTGTFSSGADITERNRALEALRTAEERMRFALKSADVGIWDMDYASGMLQWSEILEAQYGLKPGTFAGTFEAFVERVHPDDRQLFSGTIEKAAKLGTEFSVQNRAIRPDGTVRWLSGAGRVVLGEHGEPVRAIGISLDITERRTLEEQYHQAQKMEAIGRLAGGVAHDFNNVLTAILGYCELLLTDLAPADPRRADIGEIQKAGARAAGLTCQLLAFSRKQIIEPTRLDLNAIVRDIMPMLGRLIGEDVEIVLGLGAGLAPTKADRGQVEQVVVNLAVNARDAMPKGGRLTIDTANVELDEHYASMHLAVKPGPYVVLTVADTGTGMTPEVQARLFEPFFTTKDVGKGTGLGLATVQGIVARSGGSVSVRSEVGQGTSFKVYFPRAEAAESIAAALPPVARMRAGAETVLVVEDSDGLRELAKRLLERQGYTVFVAANAADALELFERHASIDVILTDVVMPGASGPELTRELVERRPGLKVIYMSGYTEDAIVHHGVLNPGIAFLHKPFTSQTLGGKVREVLDQVPA